MVKGISKRVIVVKAPIDSMFEQAIFILNENAASSPIDAEKVLNEACAAADIYVKEHCRHKKNSGALKKLLVVAGIAAAAIITAVYVIFSH